MTAKERERAFLFGAPLAIVPALVFLPAVMFLIVFPQVAHGRAIGLFVLSACALAGKSSVARVILSPIPERREITPIGRPGFWPLPTPSATATS